jgi:hypothetical protein
VDFVWIQPEDIATRMENRPADIRRAGFNVSAGQNWQRILSDEDLAFR